MLRVASVLLLAFVVPAFNAFAKAPVPAELVHDQYVALGYETAQGFIPETDVASFVDAKILPQDRQALANVHDALDKWKRYIVTINPREAEMLIAVRAGRVASANGGVRIGTIPGGIGLPPSRGIGPVVGGEAGPANDYLAVYQNNNGREGARLWVKSEDGGLSGKDPELVQALKKDVEAQAKKQGSKH
jgi:hypothetical protein